MWLSAREQIHRDWHFGCLATLLVRPAVAPTARIVSRIKPLSLGVVRWSPDCWSVDCWSPDLTIAEGHRSVALGAWHSSAPAVLCRINAENRATGDFTPEGVWHSDEIGRLSPL